MLRTLLILVVSLVFFSLSAPDVQAQSMLSDAYAETDNNYSSSARAGREIWMFATADNDRFFTYSYPQKLGVAVDWYGILGAPFSNDLFQSWGAIPDPDCCIPGTPNCPAKSLDETYGFPYCPGDDELLKFVGNQGYKDPACDIVDSVFDPNTPHGATDQRQSSCDLKYGTSTGALGLRKFPNPRFDLEKWTALNDGLETWNGFRGYLSDDPNTVDGRFNRLMDPSVEPPFTIGMACGACHISYDPLNPPADPNHPEWDNIKALLGNQYSSVSKILASGMPKNSLEWQAISNARPGIVDTSAIPMDHVTNPGTMNAIINLAQRPTFEHNVEKWRKTDACEAGENCWCEPDKPGKCWEKSAQKEKVHHILKGGEDDIGVLEAIQRVYFNIGSCGEQCWTNHISDIRAADPEQRNYGQTPFEIAQCRRDCAGFRAIEDRLTDICEFFLTARPTDLWEARSLNSLLELEQVFETEYFEGAVDLGRQVYAENCARCHSSQKGPYDNTDFHTISVNDDTLRLDWLGNDEIAFTSEFGVNSARSLHSNHIPSRVWSEFASNDQPLRASDPLRQETRHGSGRGYMRNISLLSAWAHAPFLHNNSIGPEICGKPSEGAIDHYDSPYVDANGMVVTNAPECWAFDPSVEGRYKLFVASMEALLNPDNRIEKRFVLQEDILVDIVPDLEIGAVKAGLTMRIAKGTPASAMTSLRYKDLIQDLIIVDNDIELFKAKYSSVLDEDKIGALETGLKDLRSKIIGLEKQAIIELVDDQSKFAQQFYSNTRDSVENQGHRFGESLSDREKQALIAFVATL